MPITDSYTNLIEELFRANFLVSANLSRAQFLKALTIEFKLPSPSSLADVTNHEETSFSNIEGGHDGNCNRGISLKYSRNSRINVVLENGPLYDDHL